MTQWKKRLATWLELRQPTKHQIDGTLRAVSTFMAGFILAMAIFTSTWWLTIIALCIQIPLAIVSGFLHAWVEDEEKSLKEALKAIE